MRRLARYAWVVLLYNLAVIAWGAYVRATGSGAGCGAHWPLCNGEVVPRGETVEQLIEFSHRLTSGVALVAVVALFVWARRATPPGHPVRRGATLSLVFMLTEALLGAGLVLFQLVANDASAARAFAVAAHLLNTFLLLAALTLTVFWASGGGPMTVHAQRDGIGRLIVGGTALLVVSVAGAITALGDTLFPSATLSEGLNADLSAASHFLIRLRTIHPVLAVLTALHLMATVWPVAGGRASGLRLARTVVALLALQLAVGMVNVLLLAPVWLQLVHLLLADAIWVAWVFLAADALSTPETVTASSAPYPRTA